MPCTEADGGVWGLLRHIKDAGERDIERARLNGTKSPLSFHERKARRIARAA